MMDSGKRTDEPIPSLQTPRDPCTLAERLLSRSGRRGAGQLYGVSSSNRLKRSIAGTPARRGGVDDSSEHRLDVRPRTVLGAATGIGGRLRLDHEIEQVFGAGHHRTVRGSGQGKRVGRLYQAGSCGRRGKGRTSTTTADG